ncbi:MAG: hypothetical protein ACR2HV_03785 [Acidimicrobiales bacterium]
MLSILWALLIWASIVAVVLMVLGRLWAGPPARPGTDARARLENEFSAIDAEIERLQHRR